MKKAGVLFAPAFFGIGNIFFGIHPFFVEIRLSKAYHKGQSKHRKRRTIMDKKSKKRTLLFLLLALIWVGVLAVGLFFIKRPQSAPGIPKPAAGPEYSLSPLSVFKGGGNIAVCDDGAYYYGYKYPGAITFYDEKTGQSVPLCSSPSCAHNDENCTAWVGTETFHLFMDDTQSTLFMVISGYDGSSETFHSCLYQMDRDGANRKLLLDSTNGDLQFLRFAGNEQDLYFVNTVWLPEGDRCQLFRLNRTTGELTVLEQFDHFTTLAGAFNQTLLLEMSNDITTGRQADLVLYDLETQEQTPVFHYEISPNDDEYCNGNPVGFANNSLLYIFEPSGKDAARVSVMDLVTGRTEPLCEDVPYWGAHTCVDSSPVFADGKLFLELFKNTPNGDHTETMLVLDLATGKSQLVDLKVRYPVGDSVLRFFGAAGDHYVVDTTRTRPSKQTEVMGKDGAPHLTDLGGGPEFAVITREDYFAQKKNLTILE